MNTQNFWILFACSLFSITDYGVARLFVYQDSRNYKQEKMAEKSAACFLSDENIREQTKERDLKIYYQAIIKKTKDNLLEADEAQNICLVKTDNGSFLYWKNKKNTKVLLTQIQEDIASY